MEEAAQGLSGAEELHVQTVVSLDEPSLPPSCVTHHQASRGASSSCGMERLCHWEEDSVFPLWSEIAAAERRLWAELVPPISCVLCLHSCACPSVCLAPPHLWDLVDLLGWGLEQPGLVKVGGTARALRAFPIQSCGSVWLPHLSRVPHICQLETSETAEWQRIPIYLCNCVQVLEHTVLIQVNTLQIK